MTIGGVDQKYLKLYREYSRALSSFDLATRERQRRRAPGRVGSGPRRPVGAPEDFTFPPEAPPSPPSAPPPLHHYMGRILDWVEFQHRPSPAEMPDPLASFDADGALEEVSRRLYAREREHFERARKAFFDYARELDRRRHLNRMGAHQRAARSALRDAANAQLMGSDTTAEAALEAVRVEVEAACREAWEAYGRGGPQAGASVQQHRARAALSLGNASNAQSIGSEVESERMLALARVEMEAACEKAWSAYQKSPVPRGEEIVAQMLRTLEEAELLGVRETATIQAMELEVTRLRRAPGRIELDH